MRQLADVYGVTVVGPSGKTNKGWAGHVVERFLGIPLNSAQAPNFGSWELKVVPLKRLRDGTLVVKETMAITMIDPVDVAQKSYSDSHLRAKLAKAVIVARIWEGKDEPRSVVHSVATFELADDETNGQIEADYEAVRELIRKSGFQCLSGKMGVLVQPRTKGPGHGSTSRAFYARKQLVRTLLGLDDAT